MNRFLNLVIVITFIGLTSVALFAVPQQDACGDPCGKPTAWDEFNKFELKMTVPKEPGYSFWKGTFGKESLDIQIDVEVLGRQEITKGQIFMVGGRVLATRGPITEPGYEIDAAGCASLEQELVVRLLGARITLREPQEIKGTRKIDYKNRKRESSLPHRAHRVLFQLRWSVSGDVNVVAANVVEYQLRLTAAGTGKPCRSGGEYMANFDGRLLKIASAKIEDSMPLGGWNLFGVGNQTRPRATVQPLITVPRQLPLHTKRLPHPKEDCRR